MTRYELLIELNNIKYLVDVEPNLPVSLNFQQSDITDPLSRQASFSKTIKLLDTPNNRMIFSDISDINSDLDFNPNLKIKAWILVDSIVNFQGYLQIKNFTSGRFESGYDAVIYSDLDNIFKSIGDKNLSQLTLTDLNHTLTLNTITSSWTNDIGYLYPIVDYGYNWSANNLGTITEGIVFDGGALRPSIKTKTIFDRIFSDAGYTYESSFLDSEEFNKLYELYNIELKADLLDRYKFTVGLNGDQNITKTYSKAYSGITNFSQTGDILRFDDLSAPNVDPDNLWNLTSTFGGPYNFLNTIPFVTDQYFYTDIEVWVFDPRNATASYTSAATVNNNNNNYGALTIKKNNQIMNQLVIGITNSQGNVVLGTPPQWDYFGNLANQNSVGGGITYIGATVSSGYRYFIYNLETRTDFASPDGGTVPQMVASGYEQVQFQLNSNFGSTLLSSITSSIPLFIIKDTKSDINIANPNTTTRPKSLIYNNIGTTIVNNMPVNMAKLLPTNVKQKDWFLSIIRMFNLILEPSKEISNHIIIKPRDEYFSGGQVKDWTDKWDISQSLNGQILGDTQNKTFIYTYKDDTDYLNVTYKSKVNQSYSSYREDIDNDFVNGEKKLELLHSPTPIQPTPIGAPVFIVPAIYTLSDSTTGNQQQTTFNPRILYYNGLVNTSTYYLRQSNVINGTAFTQYPQLSHYTNNFSSDSYDLGFGQNPLGYYDNRTETNNNLFERFHKTQFVQLTDKNSRIITVDLLLDANDIANFNFSDKIFIDNNYYYVNKILDYNPGESGTCKVELIKTYATVAPKLTKKFTIGGPIIPMHNKSIIDIGFENQYSGSTNRIITNGYGNVISGEDNVVYGSFNTVSGTGSFVVGNNIISTQSGVIIFGSTPQIVTNGVTGSFLSSGTYDPIVGVNNIGPDGRYNMISGQNNNLNGSSGNNNVSGSSNILNSTNFGIIGGYGNSLTSSFDSIIGGGSNSVDSTSRSLVIGLSNEVYWTDSSIVSGTYNLLFNSYESIVGGRESEIYGSIRNSISGLSQKLSNSSYNNISGGNNGSTNSSYNIISGNNNSLTASYTSIIGGAFNIINDSYYNIIGGFNSYITSSSRSIFAGSNHQITSSDYNNISGDVNSLTNSYYNAVSGETNTLDSSDYNNVSGQSNVLTTSDYNNISGKFGESIDGSYNILFGLNSYVENSAFSLIGGNGTSGMNGDGIFAVGSILTSDGFSYTFLSGQNVYVNSEGELARNALNGTKRQFGSIQTGATTTDATPTRTFPNAGHFYITSNSTYQINIRVVGTKASSGDSVSYEAKGIIKNVGGTTSLVSAITATQIQSDAALTTTAVTVTADNSNDALNVSVTGIAATTIYWHCVVDYIKMTFV
jgi:hypothetical protein